MTESFPPGFSVVYDSQEYRPLGIREHVARDGSVYPVVDWQTECPSCAVTFVIFTRMAFEQPTRRCGDCKRPGQMVRTQRRQTRPLSRSPA